MRSPERTSAERGCSESHPPGFIAHRGPAMTGVITSPPSHSRTRSCTAATISWCGAGRVHEIKNTLCSYLSHGAVGSLSWYRNPPHLTPTCDGCEKQSSELTTELHAASVTVLPTAAFSSDGMVKTGSIVKPCPPISCMVCPGNCCFCPSLRDPGEGWENKPSMNRS